MLSYSIEIPEEWDILVTLTGDCLKGFAPGWAEVKLVNPLPAGAVFHVSQVVVLDHERVGSRPPAAGDRAGLHRPSLA